MSQSDIIMPTQALGDLPHVRKITLRDVEDSLRRGVDDFRHMPTHVIFIGILYPIIGFLLWAATIRLDLIPLLYPVASGFALVGPFAAIGLYELSRRRERNLEATWGHAFDIFYSPSLGSILRVAATLLVLFIGWVATAHILYVTYLGPHESQSLARFLERVLTTPEGRQLMIIGNLVGLMFATLAFSLSVVAIPLLLDRNVGAAVAMATSVAVVAKNPLVMAAWALIVAALLALGSVPLLVGLVFVVPILGHTTWHLYRKAIEPDDRPRPRYKPATKGPRYAADFPASLFARTYPKESSEGQRSNRQPVGPKQA